jgi:hypothetical protein
MCIGEMTEDSPKEGEPGRRTEGDAVEPSAADRNDDVATWVVLWPRDWAESDVGPEYMRSMVGRSARPKSVERKSDGRSTMHVTEQV